MGIFNFSKEGPGVSKDLYETPMQIFFGVLFRKFWKFIRISLMYFVSTIPLWGLLFVVSTNDIVTKASMYGLLFIIISVIGCPLFNTGFAFVFRNFSRQRHAWIFHDLIQNIKKNIKQSFALLLLDIFMAVMAFSCYVFYSNPELSGGTLFSILSVFYLIVFTVYFMMHYFIYTIMVTFDMKFSEILKNSFLLTVMKLPRNVGITVLLFLIGYVMFGFGAFTGVILSALFFSAFANYTVTFNAVSLMDKYLMPEEEEDDDDTEFLEELRRREEFVSKIQR